MTALQLRPYQAEAISAILGEFASGRRRTAAVLPTGMGKTVIFAHLIRRWLAEHGGRAVVLVHRDELAAQALDKIRQVDPDLHVGLVQAERRDYAAQVLVCSVQTVSRPDALQVLPELGVSLVVVDECHHAAAPTWRAVIDTLSGRAFVVGFTATLDRADDRGLGEVFETVAYRRSIVDGILGGYLVPPRGRRIVVQGLRLDNVKVHAGDFVPGHLGSVLGYADAPRVVAKAYAEHAGDRPGVAFWPTVTLATTAAEALRDQGIPAAAVHGSMPLDERRATLQAFMAGDLQVLTNAMVLTEGWDAPRAEVCVIARPTRSPALYVQMVGRVLRPYPGKREALVLDVSGASEDHRLATLAVLAQDVARGPYGDQPPLHIPDGALLTDVITPELARRGQVIAQDVDLFHRDTLWLRTYDGVPFIPAGDDIVFLWPDDQPGRYRVGLRRRRGGEWLRTGLDLEMALLAAEDAASERAQYSSRSAPWRRRREPPSPGQLELAQRLGLYVPDGATKRDVSDLISIHFASGALDRAYRALQEQRK